MTVNNQKFIPPLYDSEDDIDDDIETTDEGKVETDLENKQKMNIETPFSKPNNPSPVTPPTWNNSPNNGGGSSFWGSGGQQSSSPTWGSGSGSTTAPTWGQQKPSYGGYGGSTWGSNPSSTPSWSSNPQQKVELDRTKKIVFCDVLDCLVETYQSNGRPGLLPRGIYDIKLRFDVWDKIGCIAPERIYAMVPRESFMSANGSRSWEVTLEYICCCMTEYLRLPFTSAQIITQCAVGQPKEEVIGGMMNQIGLDPDDILYIGLGSGLAGQSNRDSLTASNLGISYVDLGQLMTLHF